MSVFLLFAVVKFNRNRPERHSATCVWRSPPPVIAIPPPKVVAPPPGDAVPSRLDGPHCIFGQLMFGKIITILLPPKVRF